jgi:hypothetical protein
MYSGGESALLTRPPLMAVTRFATVDWSDSLLQPSCITWSGHGEFDRDLFQHSRSTTANGNLGGAR